MKTWCRCLNSKGLFLSLLAAGLTTWATTGWSQVIIHQESFESAPSPATYTTEGEFTSGLDFFARINNTFAHYPIHPANPDGSFYFGGRNTDGPGTPNGGIGIITLAPLDVSNYSKLQVRLAIQHAGKDYEPADYIEVYAVVDGGEAKPMGAVRGSEPNTDALWQDGDTTATGTTTNFTDFVFDVPGEPKSLVVMVCSKADFRSESFAFDNLRVVGHPLQTHRVIFNRNATSVTGTSGVMNAGFEGTGAVYDVWLHWGPADSATDASRWTYSALVGTFTNQAATHLTHSIAGLLTNTESFFTWQATNLSENLWARPSLNFKTLGPPKVENDGGAFTNIIAQADLRGMLNAGAAADITIYWGRSDGGTTPNAWDAALKIGSKPEGHFLGTASNLSFGVPYFYRTYGTNAYGHDWADNTTNFFSAFFPGAGIANQAAAGRTKTSAVMKANFNGIGSVFAVTLYWGPKDGGTAAGAWAHKQEFGSYTNQAFTKLSHVLSGLSADDIRFYTWRASNQVLDVWGGASIRFKTQGSPTVDNKGGASDIGAGVVILNGSFTSSDRGDVSIYYGTSDGGTTSTDWNASTNLGPVPAPSFLASVPTSNLLYGLDYFYRSYATNAFAGSWAPTSTAFRIRAPLGVGLLNPSVSGRSSTSAVLHAELSAPGAVFYVTAYWGPVDGGTDPAAWLNKAFLGSFANTDLTNLNVTATGLSVNSRYAYTFQAANAATSVWFLPSPMFTTLGAPPRVDNAGGAANISAHTATLSGQLIQGGGANAYVVWGDNDPGTMNPDDWDYVRSVGKVAQGAVFSTGISGLSESSTNHYRCFVSNAFGVAWSAPTQFTTPGTGTVKKINKKR